MKNIGKTDRSVNEVYSDIKPMIEADWQSTLLFALRAVSSLLVMFKKLVSEGNQFNIGATGITQEFKGKGNFGNIIIKLAARKSC